jgi:hypothetical protein
MNSSRQVPEAFDTNLELLKIAHKIVMKRSPGWMNDVLEVRFDCYRVE